MIGERSSELAQSVTDLIVLLLFCFLSFIVNACACDIGLHRSFVSFSLMRITIDPLHNAFLGIVCEQAHCRTRSLLLAVFFRGARSFRTEVSVFVSGAIET